MDVTGIILIFVIFAAGYGLNRLDTRYRRLHDRYERAAVSLAFYRVEAAGHVEEGAYNDFYTDLAREVLYRRVVSTGDAVEDAGRVAWWRRRFAVYRAGRRHDQAIRAWRSGWEVGYAPPAWIGEYIQNLGNVDDEDLPAWRERLGHDEVDARGTVG
jgi:hypothetical protein